ncbi:SRPBCC family protein [Hyalangium gracile]|uniref:SRPBCC family protein n=1 Tax=Hyalangium gracile TaxID=394092 RepID=UPI001CCFB33A|nr:SRPBCC family protein [Hyalangium gracile]
MLKKLLLGLVAALLAVVGFIASRPSTYTVERSLTMKASPKYIFPFVNSFYRWADWSPWNYLDLEMKRTYDGPVLGEGAVYAWAGNDKVGEGRMTLVESRKDEFVRIKLERFKPLASTSMTSLTIKPAAEGATVTWTLEGQRDFMAKAASLFMDTDAMLGKDFETGLDTLRIEAEATQVEKEEQKIRRAEMLKALAEAQAEQSPGAAPATPPAPKQ